MKNDPNDHYHWLDKNLDSFVQNLTDLKSVYGDISLKGSISADADKCYSYKGRFSNANIPFEHGVAIYLLTYYRPYSKEVRETPNGWVDPCDWIIKNYPKFKPFLPKATSKFSRE